MPCGRCDLSDGNRKQVALQLLVVLCHGQERLRSKMSREQPGQLGSLSSEFRIDRSPVNPVD